ncbi:MAG: hypothetical protein ACRD44_10870, partial [Bryobacteraceae bacterium]
PNNFDLSPRAGFAYRIRPDFVLRGGFGIYYVDVTVNEFRSAINVAPFIRRAQLSRSLLISQNVDVNRLFTFQNPTANSNAAGADTQLTTLDGFNADYPTQRAYTWNVTIEKELGRQFGLRTSYAGNVGWHLSRTVRVNSCVPGPTECLARTASDPTARKWSQFGTNVGQRFGDGDSNYNAWEIELQKRFAGGFLFDVNYAYSRTFRLEPTATNPVADPKWRYDYGQVPAQPTNVFHWNYVWEVPYGKGRKFGAGVHPVVNAVLGEWMFAGLGTWQSGQPLTITTSNGQSPTGAASNRADRIADGRLDQSGRSRSEAADRWFDTAAYVQPALIDSRATRPTRQFGTAGVGTVLGPSFFTYDFQVQKTVALRERYRLQFRAEMFNPFNVPMLGNPDTNVVSANFGRIRTSNANYTPRNVQFGFRLDF